MPFNRRLFCTAALATLLTAMTGCATVQPQSGPVAPDNRAKITPTTETHNDLVSLPLPKGKIFASVYAFRDETGQYKPAPDSSFSTSVTQGATSMLIKAMLDSRWFVPVEREGLQDLLTERKIVRAAEGKGAAPIPSLYASSILLEGGIIGYESNVRTGGAGAKYLGIGPSEQYREDQVTVNLRAVDIHDGRVLASVFTTKTIFSRQISVGLFGFVKFKRLLEVETGYTENEPTQLCVRDAVEAALISLIAQGVHEHLWAPLRDYDVNAPIFKAYLDDLNAKTADAS